MKCTRIKTEELELEHMRDVFYRKPVRGRPMGERPFQIMKRHTAVYFWNLVNVFGIVVVDEWKSDCLPEHEPNESDEAYTNSGNNPAFGNLIAHFASSDRAAAFGAGKDRHLP